MGYIDYSKSCGSELLLSIPARSPARLHPSTRAQILLHARLRGSSSGPGLSPPLSQASPSPAAAPRSPFFCLENPRSGCLGVCRGRGGHRAGSSPLLAAGSGLPTLGLGARGTSPPCFPRSPSLSQHPPPGATHPPHSPSRSSLCRGGVMVVVCVCVGGVTGLARIQQLRRAYPGLRGSPRASCSPP